jgi:hypothetical protein
VRKFALKNSEGSILPLADGKNPFLYRPKGLGAALDLQCGAASDGFFRATKRLRKQASITGDLVFTTAAYARYAEVMAWIEQSAELDPRIGYAPNGEDYFYAACIVRQVSKTERSLWGGLQCGIEITLLTPWSAENPLTVTIAPSTNALSYPKTYPYAYGSTSAAGETPAFTLSGHMRGAYELTIAGALTNPNIQLMQLVNGGWATIGRCALTATISSTETLRFSTRPDTAGVWKTNSSGIVTDLAPCMNLYYDAFVRPPVGVPCKIVITSAATISTAATVLIYDYYDTV